MLSENERGERRLGARCVNVVMCSRTQCRIRRAIDGLTLGVERAAPHWTRRKKRQTIFLLSLSSKAILLFASLSPLSLSFPPAVSLSILLLPSLKLYLYPVAALRVDLSFSLSQAQRNRVNDSYCR